MKIISQGLSLFVVIFLSCVSCQHKKEEAHEMKPYPVVIQGLSNDFKIPSAIWDQIEGKVEEGKEHFSASIAFIKIKVTLTEKNPGVLLRPSYVIDLPRGGGDIDLSEYLSGQAGTFYVKFDFAPEEGTFSTLHYLSNARKRKIDEKIVGAGCNTFMNIKSYWQKVATENGIIVNTSRQRHLSVLGGRFIFSAKGERQTYVSQVNFTDSQKPQYFCSSKPEPVESTDKKSAEE